VGRGVRAAAGEARLRGAGDDERRLRVLDRPTRQHDRARADDRACRGDRRRVDLPVSADLENGFGDDPEACAETIRLGAAAGLAGGSIEDSTDTAEQTIYDIELAAERILAAAEAAHALSFPFMLTARCENFLVGRRDLDDTIRRLQRYQEAGADVLYAPGLTSQDDLAAVVRAVDRPVNALPLPGVDAAQLSAIGVRRISVGSALARAAYGAFLEAAHELRGPGTFTFSEKTISFRDLSAMF
jgi:2-methylisocitrate lyase-like PEP mutase family enzyme